MSSVRRSSSHLFAEMYAQMSTLNVYAADILSYMAAGGYVAIILKKKKVK